MDLHGRLEGQVSALLVKEGMFVCGVSQPFVSVRSYQHSGGVVVAVTRMPDTACPSRNSTILTKRKLSTLISYKQSISSMNNI